MNIFITTFADDKFKKQQDDLNNLATDSKFSGCFSYSDTWLYAQDFYKQNESILSQRRGFGYWLWKPYIILETLKKINNGDIIFYIDCGDTFDKRIPQYILPILSKENCLLLGNRGQNINKDWTKRDCFYYMDCDSPKYTDAYQLEAGVQIWKKTDQSIEIVNKYLNFCKDYRILTDTENVCGLENYSTFIDHRHDQSILTNIAIMHNLPIDSPFLNTNYKYLGSFLRHNI